VSAEFREAATALLGVKLTFFLGRVVRVTSLLDVRSSFVFGPRACPFFSSLKERGLMVGRSGGRPDGRAAADGAGPGGAGGGGAVDARVAWGREAVHTWVRGDDAARCVRAREGGGGRGGWRVGCQGVWVSRRFFAARECAVRRSWLKMVTARWRECARALVLLPARSLSGQLLVAWPIYNVVRYPFHLDAAHTHGVQWTNTAAPYSCPHCGPCTAAYNR
jgi:hypothetical protein